MFKFQPCAVCISSLMIVVSEFFNGRFNRDLKIVEQKPQFRQLFNKKTLDRPILRPWRPPQRWLAWRHNRFQRPFKRVASSQEWDETWYDTYLIPYLIPTWYRTWYLLDTYLIPTSYGTWYLLDTVLDTYLIPYLIPTWYRTWYLLDTVLDTYLIPYLIPTWYRTWYLVDTYFIPTWYCTWYLLDTVLDTYLIPYLIPTWYPTWYLLDTVLDTYLIRYLISTWYCTWYLLEPRKKLQCIVYVRELYYITFAKEKCWVAKDRESNLLRERSRKRSLRYFKLFVLFSGNGPVWMDGKLTSGSLGSQLWESGVTARVVKCVEDCSQSSI